MNFHPHRIQGVKLAALMGLLVCSASSAGAQQDQWSPDIPLRQAGSENFLAPIHATLLPNGDVMLIGFSQAGIAPGNVCERNGSMTAILRIPPAGQPLPEIFFATRYAEDVIHQSSVYCPEGGCGNACVADVYFCSGHTLLADGTLMVVGGTRSVSKMPRSQPRNAGGGLQYSSLWDSASSSWSRILEPFAGVPAGAYVDLYFSGRERYYPTATRLPDGKVLIIGGSQSLGGGIIGGPAIPSAKNLVVDLYDPSAPLGSQYTALAVPGPAEVFNVDYTHTFVLPNVTAGGHDVVMVGDDGKPVFLETSSSTWSAAQSKRPNPSGISNPCKGASSVMLPIRVDDGEFDYANGSLLIAGGEVDYGGDADVYDLGVGSMGDWDLKLSLGTARHHPATVLLPDGQVLVTAGHEPGNPSGTFQIQAEYINPRSDFSVTQGSTAPGEVSRGYHMAALLLPDGRVMITGGRAGGDLAPPIERASVQILSPPYMFRERPVIVSAPVTLTAGSPSPASIRVAGGVSEAVLVGLGSMTHSFDMNQRHVELDLVAAMPHVDGKPGFVGGIVPPSVREAPPGYYMLFVLGSDTKRTPSTARIVRVL